MSNSFIIAELGSNPAAYDWDFDRFCRAAKLVGADAVKVQVFRAESFPVGEQASKRPLEFPRDRFAEFVETAHRYGLKAGASVFDTEAVELVARHGDFIKLAAREENNKRLIGAVVAKQIAVYRSVTFSDNARMAYGGGVTPLLTIPRYPTRMIDALVFVTKNRVDLARGFGWSSHTRGWLDCWLAAKLGASVIEKHFSLSKDDIEAGHSLLPDDFVAMVRGVKQ